jgi:hypothetical protein
MEIARMSDWVKKNYVLKETERGIGVPLTPQQTAIIMKILSAMEERMPDHAWRDTSLKVLSALHLRNLVNSSAISLENLNTKGRDAVQYGNELIENAKRMLDEQAKLG